MRVNLYCSKLKMAACAVLCMAMAAGWLRSAQAQINLPANFKTYNPPGYYVFHTDVSRHMLQQIWLRMNFAAHAYDQRLHAIFGGSVTQKQPFYLFKHRSDYLAAGAPPGSAGVFMIDQYGQRLMGDVGNHISHQTWHIIQHEGFHQFTFAFIHAFLPAWANEGTAEYFGEGLFTGNSFVTGWIPPYRLARIKFEMRHHKLLPIHTMRRMPYSQWNDVLLGTNYDEAWSMIYFLAWANHQKYATPFVRYLVAYHNGVPSEQAWDHIFGADDAAFQKLWEKYWLTLPVDPTAELYARVQTQTLTNYLARAWALHQTFKHAADFLHSAQDGSLKQYKLPNRNWLPSSLLKRALAAAGHVGTWSLSKARIPHLICTMPDGTKLIGIFRLSEGQPGHVFVRVVPAKRGSIEAAAAAGKLTDQAPVADRALDTVAQ